MDPNKITAKVAEAVNAARDLALESNHQALTPVHLAVSMLEDGEGLARQRTGQDERCSQRLASHRVSSKGQACGHIELLFDDGEPAVSNKAR